MIAVCIDDEPILLENLRLTLEASPDITEAHAFSRPSELVEWVKNNHCDIAFLDIRMHDTDGLTLAEELRDHVPSLPIVFCTAYRDYTYDAFSIHADGYILKPVRIEAIQREIDHIKGLGKRRILLTVSRSDGRLVLHDRDGKLLHFKRKKTTEFLTILYDRRGAFVSTEELCELLWGNNDIFAKKNKAYLWQLVHDLGNILEPISAFEVLRRGEKGYALDMSLLATEE